MSSRSNKEEGSSTRRNKETKCVLAFVIAFVYFAFGTEFSVSTASTSIDGVQHAITNLDDLSPILKGQWNRLLLLEKGIEPILPAPVVDEKNTTMDPHDIKRYIISFRHLHLKCFI